jgi:serine phosphatase RsbU (regulator of sigma subunit)
VYALDGATPGEVVAGLNRFTIDTAVTSYTTLMYGVFDPANGVIEWTCAGHPPMVWQRGKHAEALAARHGMPIGVMDGPYQSSRTVLDPGDRVLIYTDGLIERRTEALDEGIQRLRDSMAETADLPLDDALDKILGEVAPADREDDVCALILERPHS